MEEDINDAVKTLGFDLSKINKTPLALGAVQQYQEGIISKGQLVNVLRKIEKKFGVILKS